VEKAVQQDNLILTVSSKKKVEAELTELYRQKPEIAEAIRKARAYGDLSENFEYQAARQSQAILNGKIAELEALLDKATIVEDGSVGGDSVGIGSIVKVRDLETEDEWEYTIVDATSADPVNDLISYTSPVGQALMKRKLGEVIEIAIPDGKALYEIVGLRHM
jgi:transcription elongation factor GreA